MLLAHRVRALAREREREGLVVRAAREAERVVGPRGRLHVDHDRVRVRRVRRRRARERQREHLRGARRDLAFGRRQRGAPRLAAAAAGAHGERHGRFAHVLEQREAVEHGRLRVHDLDRAVRRGAARRAPARQRGPARRGVARPGRAPAVRDDHGRGGPGRAVPFVAAARARVGRRVEPAARRARARSLQRYTKNKLPNCQRN